MKISPDNDYTRMQKKDYERRHIRHQVTGEDNSHEMLRDNYIELMFGGIENTENMIALDFAYGHGRTIEAFSHLFKRIDGVDMMSEYIPLVMDRLRAAGLNPNGKLYTCNGVDLSVIDSGQYDIVYTMISLHHIPVRDIRNQYFREFHRVLVPGGRLSFQMFFSKKKPIRGQASSYNDNEWNSMGTNGSHDVWISSNDLKSLKLDLVDAGFSEVEFTFFDPNPKAKSVLGMHEQMLFISAVKGV